LTFASINFCPLSGSFCKTVLNKSTTKDHYNLHHVCFNSFFHKKCWHTCWIGFSCVFAGPLAILCKSSFRQVSWWFNSSCKI
jgi:hypothetical protein